ncbi:alpha/beta hydrolase (plasmid) [Ralstonia solanacearum]|nr:alpha/beta hydrolase [Ralstonia solanacearum]
MLTISAPRAELPDCGHMMMLKPPDRFSQAILRLLYSCIRQSPFGNARMPASSIQAPDLLEF